MNILIKKQEIFMKTKTLIYTFMGGLLGCLILAYIFFVMLDYHKEEKDLDRNLLLEIMRIADKNIATRPMVGSFIETKEILKRVRNLAVEDKNLCEMGGLWQLILDEEGQPIKLICGEKSNNRNKIITPRLSFKNYQQGAE